MKITLSSLFAAIVVAFTATSSSAQIASLSVTSLSVGSDNYAGGAGQGVQIIGLTEAPGQASMVGIVPFQLVPGFIGATNCSISTQSHGNFAGYWSNPPIARLTFNLNSGSAETAIIAPLTSVTGTYCTQVYGQGAGFSNVSLRAWAAGTAYTSPQYAGSSPQLTFTLVQPRTVTIAVYTQLLGLFGLTPASQITTTIIDQGAAVTWNSGTSYSNRTIYGDGYIVEALQPGTYTVIVNATGGVNDNGDVLISVTADQ